MRVARASMLLAAAAMLVCGLHLTLALPAEVAEKPVKEAVAPRDPEEHHAEEHHQEHPPSSGGGFHIPRPSEIIHAVGSYVQGSHYQHVQEHHDQHVQSAHEHAQAAHEHVEEHHNEHHRPTHRPPHRPLHRPHGEKDKIKATKTVLVEFTKRVTRHPVCMKVYGVKPPCLPFEAYSSKGVQNKPCQHGLRDDNNAAEEEEDDFYGEPELKEGLYISPSAAVELPSVTKLVDTPDDLEETARSARYLELRAPAAPAAPAAAAAPATATPALPAEQTARQHLIAGAADAIHTGASGLLGHHNKPDVIVEYHTLWVTKVEKVWDHRVTATLVAENCVPTDSKIPFCGGHGYGPTYEGGDEIVYKPAHKPVYKPVHKPVHQEPVHKPVHHEPVHKPVHHEPVHKPVHHEPVHKPVHHEPVHHEPAHKPVHHEPVHKPVHHEPVHKPVHHEPAYKPVHHEPAHKPEQGVEYSEGPEDHHWKEGEEESNNATEEVNDNAEAARTESSE